MCGEGIGGASGPRAALPGRASAPSREDEREGKDWGGRWNGDEKCDGLIGDREGGGGEHKPISDAVNVSHADP